MADQRFDQDHTDRDHVDRQRIDQDHADREHLDHDRRDTDRVDTDRVDADRVDAGRVNQDQVDRLRPLYDATVYGEGGHKIGRVSQVYLDDRSGEPSWATVSTGWFGTKETFVPLDDARIEGDRIDVPYTKEFVKDAPNIDAELHLDGTEEAQLYRYYSKSYDDDAAGPGAAERGDHREHAAGLDHDRHDHDRHDHDPRDHDHDRERHGLDPRDHDRHDHDRRDHDRRDHDRHDLDPRDQDRHDHDRHDRHDHDRHDRQHREHDLEADGRAPIGVAPVRGGHDEAAPVDRGDGDARVGAASGHSERRLRLRKHIVTEQETVTVPVQREVYTIEPEPGQEQDVLDDRGRGTADRGVQERIDERRDGLTDERRDGR